MSTQTLAKTGFKAAVFLFFGYAAICTYLWAHQEHYIFDPKRNVEKTPAVHQLVFENVYLSIAGPGGRKESMHAWWIPAQHETGKILLYLHGSALNIGANVTHARRARNT
jgi:hypothetical protein